MTSITTIRKPFGDGASDQASTTSVNVGTVAAGVTAVENGDGVHHQTVLTLATTLPAIVGGTNLAVGKLIYTFPAGAINIRATSISVSVTQTEGNINADAPDGGIGTVIASGAVVVLGGTATFENLLTGQTFDDCNGTSEVKTLATSLVIEAADAHTVHFNIADGWAASGDLAAILAGTVTIEWDFIS